jgi:uncharacterized protein (TIGR03435 family)
MNTLNKYISRSVYVKLAAVLLCTMLAPAQFIAQVTSQTQNTAVNSFQGFDVITIKPNVTGGGVVDLKAGANTFNAKNISLKMLLTNAYGIRAGRIFGLPQWAEQKRWDIMAKVTDPDPALLKTPLPPPQAIEAYRAKVQFILSSRFHLRVHTENRTSDIYRMVVGPGGPKFKVTQTPESQQGVSDRRGEISAEGIPMGFLAKDLSSYIDRDVIDETGLAGKYDFNLAWNADDLASSSQSSAVTDGPPSIFTAIQEQLGLKLLPGKGPVPTLVVDSIDEPTVN